MRARLGLGRRDMLTDMNTPKQPRSHRLWAWGSAVHLLETHVQAAVSSGREGRLDAQEDCGLPPPTPTQDISNKGNSEPTPPP